MLRVDDGWCEMTISDLLVPTVPPVREDSGGVLRIGRTRVSLDSLVAAYNEGASADELAEGFPTLTLGYIHATLGFYHQNRADLDAYLEHARTEEDRLQEETQRRFQTDAGRDRIVARRADRFTSV
jgi:uncharacterized protein (DUF433 family)